MLPIEILNHLEDPFVSSCVVHASCNRSSLTGSLSRMQLTTWAMFSLEVGAGHAYLERRAAFSATRAFTIRVTSPSGRGRSGLN